jgi:hypothetical protein
MASMISCSTATDRRSFALQVDLIYSRAMMQHLPIATVQSILQNFENSGAKYVLTHSL